jgi:hypothetical protein
MGRFLLRAGQQQIPKLAAAKAGSSCQSGWHGPDLLAPVGATYRAAMHHCRREVEYARTNVPDSVLGLLRSVMPLLTRAIPYLQRWRLLPGKIYI